MALNQPLPRRKNDRRPPFYLWVPGLELPIQRKLFDPEGILINGEHKNEEIYYRFFPNVPTPVSNPKHAEWLLESMAASGIQEFAYRELPELVKEYHPRRKNYKGDWEYITTDIVENRTKRFEPVREAIVRYGTDVKKSLREDPKQRRPIKTQPTNIEDFEGEITGEETSTSLDALTVSELKEKLREKELPVSGTKNELIARLQEEQ